MDEWLKILVSALAGLCAGLIAEPVKGAISLRLKVRHVLGVVKVDYGRPKWRNNLSGWGRTPKVCCREKDLFPAAQYYWEKESDLFYRDHRLCQIGIGIQKIQEIQMNLESGSLDEENGERKLRQELESIETELRSWPLWFRTTYDVPKVYRQAFYEIPKISLTRENERNSRLPRR